MKLTQSQTNELCKYKPVNIGFYTLRNIIVGIIAGLSCVATGFIATELLHCVIIGRSLPLFGVSVMTILYMIMIIYGLISIPKVSDFLNADSRAKCGKEMFDKGYYDYAVCVGYIVCSLVIVLLCR